MITPGYEELEHTADIALRVWGGDFFALLRQSAKGMYELMGAKPNLTEPQKTNFKIEDASQELQLIDFLNEILFLAEDRASIYETFIFDRGNEGLKVRASGYVAKSIYRNIKAVTFHDLEIIDIEGGLETRITFDV